LKRAVLVTGHYALSKRRAGFHWLAEALVQQGWQVTFFTASFSHLHRLKGDHRFAYGLMSQAGQVVPVGDRLDSFVWFTPWHPANRLPSILDRLATPLFRRYGALPLGAAEPVVRNADLIVFESTAGLMLFDEFKRLNSRARFVYRVSDDLRLLRAPRALHAVERRIAPQFDLISVTSSYSLEHFAGLHNVSLHHHAIDPEPFEQSTSNPFSSRWSTNVVFVGNSHFDYDFLDIASDIFGDWSFHIIGPIRGLPNRPNVTTYGELPFRETVPYIKYADIGLQTRSNGPGMEHLSDSLKVIQYTYCRLPIVAPDFLRSARPNVFLYQPGLRSSIEATLTEARAFDRSQMPANEIWSWTDLAQRITG
jgi:2-beta-glucuronyltransferase